MATEIGEWIEPKYAAVGGDSVTYGDGANGKYFGSGQRTIARGPEGEPIHGPHGAFELWLDPSGNVCNLVLHSNRVHFLPENKITARSIMMNATAKGWVPWNRPPDDFAGLDQEAYDRAIVEAEAEARKEGRECRREMVHARAFAAGRMAAWRSERVRIQGERRRVGAARAKAYASIGKDKYGELVELMSKGQAAQIAFLARLEANAEANVRNVAADAAALADSMGAPKGKGK